MRAKSSLSELAPCKSTSLYTTWAGGDGAGPAGGALRRWLVGTMTEDSVNVVFPEEEEEGEQGISWMAEHAKQVLRLLPDGLTVLGFFLDQSDSFLVANGGTCT